MRYNHHPTILPLLWCKLIFGSHLGRYKGNLLVKVMEWEWFQGKFSHFPEKSSVCGSTPAPKAARWRRPLALIARNWNSIPPGVESLPNMLWIPRWMDINWCFGCLKMKRMEVSRKTRVSWKRTCPGRGLWVVPYGLDPRQSPWGLAPWPLRLAEP